MCCAVRLSRLRRLVPIATLILLLLVSRGAASGQAGGNAGTNAYLPLLANDSPHDWIVFVSTRDGLREDIFVVRPDGSDAQNLTGTPDCYETRPRWSLDGARLAYVRTCLPDSGVEVMDFADRSTRWLDTNGIRVNEIDWSPDGKTLAFSAEAEGNQDIYLYELASDTLIQLTDDPAIDTDPSWSPDGSFIAFNSYNNYMMDLYLAKADGSGIAKLTDLPDFKSFHLNGVPPWSPDGDKLLYVSAALGGRDIFAIDADGDNPTQLTTNEGWDVSPAWSPDGERIAYVAFTPDHKANGIAVMNQDGSGFAQLTLEVDATHSTPVWSPDGSQLLFVININGNADLYLIQPDGSDLCSLAPHPQDDFFPSWRP